jgi:hypothetical protein
MPTSGKKQAKEFFYSENGERADANLHEPILADGDSETATEIGRKVAVRLGLSPERAARLMGKKP